jgi:thiosulfate reductase cytochrome b subunit
MSDLVKIIEKHSKIIRWLHWMNFPLLSIMIWSGVLIYWAHQPYIEIPDAWAEFFHLDRSLALGMGWHFFIMWIFSINGFFYLLYLLWSGEWRSLAPRSDSFIKAIQLVLFELKIKKNPPLQIGKYNDAQRIAYTGVILMGLGAIMTGLAIYKPVQLGWLTWILGGYEAARLEHFVLMIGFIFFFLIHIFQVIRAGWNNFRGMVAGYEIDKE